MNSPYLSKQQISLYSPEGGKMVCTTCPHQQVFILRWVIGYRTSRSSFSGGYRTSSSSQVKNQQVFLKNQQVFTLRCNESAGLRR